jgi:hypothetical protein
VWGKIGSGREIGGRHVGRMFLGEGEGLGRGGGKGRMVVSRYWSGRMAVGDLVGGNGVRMEEVGREMDMVWGVRWGLGINMGGTAQFCEG